MSSIRPDTKVRYKADPSVAGWVIGVTGENARVFIDGATKLVPVAELELAPSLTEVSPDEFRTALTQRRLEHPLTDQLLSYRASRTDLYYHQFLPVKKMLESPDQRLLIADEVGTGKTIEAGLIWAELESRAVHGLENVWVVCPKSLVGKWQEEMLQRFDFRLEVLSPEGLRQALVSLERDGVLPPRFAKVVVNIELIRAEEHQARLGQAAISWDLVIFDEAHHLRNTDTFSYALAALMCERAKAALFLTATPLQTSLEDIVHLMEALGVDVAQDPRLLEEQMRWDMELNDWIRLVRRQPPGWTQDAWSVIERLVPGGTGRAGWVEFLRLLAESNLEDRSQRTVAVGAARDMQVLSPYMTRTLRSDVDEDRSTREAITRIVEFSPEEKAFYDKVYEVCLERAMDMGAPPGFVTQMPERRTASCAPAVASEILRYASEDEDEEHKASFTPSEVNTLEPFARAALGAGDGKLEALLEVLEHTFSVLDADRVMIFSTFRGTLHYLARALEERRFSYELMYGPTPARDEDCRRGEKSRERIAAEFRRGDFQVLLASEVAGEGLDFEHCHVLINYDLPWNPMRVEQRIGRCDRLGQRSDKVYVGNLASVGTIEQRILTRLYERLHIFERALGDMEVVLGEAVASFERDVFRRNLTPQQQDDRLERLSQLIENQSQQRESVTQSEVISLQGRQLMESDQDDIKEAETRFLSPEEVGEFVHAALGRHLARSMKQIGEDTYEIGVADQFRDALQALLRDYPPTHFARTEITRFRRLLEERERVRISFSGSEDDAEFAHARHPLVLLARRLARNESADTPYCLGVVPSYRVDKTTMLVWAVGTIEAYISRAELLCAAVDCDTGIVSPIPVQQAQELLRAIEPYRQGQSYDLEGLMAQAEQALTGQFDAVADSFKLRNAQLANKATQAVNSLAERRLNWLSRQLTRDDLNANIRNLYRGWSRRVESEVRTKVEDIERRAQVRSAVEIIGVAVVYPEVA